MQRLLKARNNGRKAQKRKSTDKSSTASTKSSCLKLTDYADVSIGSATSRIVFLAD